MTAVLQAALSLGFDFQGLLLSWIKRQRDGEEKRGLHGTFSIQIECNDDTRVKAIERIASLKAARKASIQVSGSRTASEDLSYSLPETVNSGCPRSVSKYATWGL